jgi:hypothetical protein
MWRRVALWRTDVSEERIASIIIVTIGVLGTMLAVISNVGIYKSHMASHPRIRYSSRAWPSLLDIGKQPLASSRHMSPTVTRRSHPFPHNVLHFVCWKLKKDATSRYIHQTSHKNIAFSLRKGSTRTEKPHERFGNKCTNWLTVWLAK